MSFIAFAARYRADPRLFQSFAVVFDAPLHGLSEAEFERHLWKRRVQSLQRQGWLAGCGGRSEGGQQRPTARTSP